MKEFEFLKMQKKNDMTGKKVMCNNCGFAYKTNRELYDTCPNCGNEFYLFYNVTK